MRLDLRLRAWLVVALLVAVTPAAHAQPMNGIGVVVTPAPMYLAPDPSRVPLATLPAGTNVRVVAREGDWLTIVYRDHYLGDRSGYVLAANIRIEPAAAAPATPRPAIPGQVAPAAAAPQAARPSTPVRSQRRDHGYLWLSGTYQNTSEAFTTTTTFSQYGGTGSIKTRYDHGQFVLADVAVGERVWRGLSVNVAVTWTKHTTDADISASVPSPLPGANPRSVSGRASDINWQEIGVHLDAAWSVPDRSRFQATVFAGPSWFQVKQGLVTGVTVNEAPPFDTVTFANAAVNESTKRHIGYNAGVEASVRLWKTLGVGGIVRYSRARVPFSPAPGTGVTIEAGGVQAGAGLHFRF